MKILYLNLAGELGGAERSLLDLMISLRASAPEVDLSVVVGNEGPFHEAARDLGFQAILVPAPRGLLGLGDSALKYEGRARAALGMAARAAPAALAAFGYVRRLRRAFASARPRLIHSNDNKSHLLAALAGTGTAPVVWHVRDFLGTRRFIGRALARASRRASGAIAISAAVAEDARNVLRGLPVVVVHNGVDLDHFRPGPGDGRRLDELAGLPEAPAGTVRVGLVATFARWKGQDLFLKAAAEVLAAPPPAPLRFYVVGGPIYNTRGSQCSEQDLRELAARLGVARQVGFTGFQRQTLGIYRALDVVVNASTEPEPFGRTIVEGMACGRPVIAALSGGAAELFTHDVDALGFEPGDASALASAIRSLAEDPARRMRLAERGRRTAVARFSRERLGPEVTGAYDRFLSAGAGVVRGRAPARGAAASPGFEETSHRGDEAASGKAIDPGDGGDVGRRSDRDE